MWFIGGAWNRPIRTFILTTSRPLSRWGHCYPNTIESGIKEPAGPKIRLPRCGRRDERALGHIHAASRYAADRRIYRTVTQAVCPNTMYHFIFVPLTLGLPWILFIMESVYVMTGKEIYKDMTRFWGKLFGINFTLGVTTGLTQEFQFGLNWSYYAHYGGDIFGAQCQPDCLRCRFQPQNTQCHVHCRGGVSSHCIGVYILGLARHARENHRGEDSAGDPFCLLINQSFNRKE
jgi:hypothetical protein